MTSPWVTAAAPIPSQRQPPIPPPPPFPPGDPRLGPPQAGYPAPPWMQQQAQPQVQQWQPQGPYGWQGAPARQLGRGPAVGLIAGAVAIVVVAIAVAWRISPRSGYLPPSVAQPPVVTTQNGSTPGTAPRIVPADPVPVAKAPTHGLDFGKAPTLAAVLPKIEAYVEEARGHHFVRPVTVTPLAPQAFLAQLHKGEPSSADEKAFVDGEGATLEALRLLPAHTDLAATMAAQTDQQVGGFYDPVSKQLFIRGTTLNPLGQVIVAHELTHALDDQYFDLYALEKKAADSDQELAIRSLIEGDARSVEDRFRAALVPVERSRADADEKAEFGSPAGAEPPIFLELQSSFPYEVGKLFVDQLRAHGGTPTLDAAFTRPPISTLQILDPQGTFLTRVDPIGHGSGTLPADQGKSVAQDSLGAFGLAAVLSEKAPTHLLEQTAAVDGWDGDSYITTVKGSETCVRDTISTRDQAGEDALHTALLAWTATHDGSSVTKGPSSLLFISCIG